MQVNAQGVMIVGKRNGTYKNGEPYYVLQLANGEGGSFNVSVDADTYVSVGGLDKRYSMVINIDTNGYKHYPKLEKIIEE